MRKRRGRASSALRGEIEIPDPPPLYGEFLNPPKPAPITPEYRRMAITQRRLMYRFLVSPYVIGYEEVVLGIARYSDRNDDSEGYGVRNGNPLLSFRPDWVGDELRAVDEPTKRDGLTAADAQNEESSPPRVRRAKRKNMRAEDRSSPARVDNRRNLSTSKSPTADGRKRVAKRTRTASRRRTESLPGRKRLTRSSSKLGHSSERGTTTERVLPQNSLFAETQADASEQFDRIMHELEEAAQEDEEDENDYTVNHQSSEDDSGGDDW